MKKNNKISLDEIGRELPFTVPENYFEHFALQIDEQINRNSASNHRFLRRWMYAAAAFVGIWGLILSLLAFDQRGRGNIRVSFPLHPQLRSRPGVLRPDLRGEKSPQSPHTIDAERMGSG